MYFNNAEWFLSRIFPDLEWSVKTDEKVIYLTFDDGPVSPVTDFVIEELDTVGAKATFFCVGDNIRKNPQLFEKLRLKGHKVGNHTQNHLNGWRVEDDRYYENVELCTKTILSHGSDHGTNLFRPPYGKIRRRQAKILKDQFRIIMWSVLSGDYDQNLTPENCLKKTIRYTKKGSIVVFHDSLKAERNLRYVLPRFLHHFHSDGYSFKSL